MDLTAATGGLVVDHDHRRILRGDQTVGERIADGVHG